MNAQDYLIALKVIREIQKKQAYCSGRSDPWLAQTLSTIELIVLWIFLKLVVV